MTAGLTWQGAAAVAGGAALGALCRWVLTVLLGNVSGLAAGTLAANGIGCLTAGLLVGVSAALPVTEPWRLFLITGFLGGLTTFSTFSTESVGFLMSGAWERWLRHLLLHVAGGLAAASLGVWIARQVLR